MKYLRLVRLYQWIKNGFIFLPAFFGFKIQEYATLTSLGFGFLSFSLMASTVYILNDIADRNTDRKHPIKKSRPIASGEVTVKTGAMLAGLSFVLAMAVSLNLDTTFALILVFYLILNIAYSVFLKNIAVVGTVVIATGFLLRVFSGGIIAQIAISQWLILTTFLLALFVSLGKRLEELNFGKPDNPSATNGYNREFLISVISVIASVTIVSYIMYTMSPQVEKQFGEKNLFLTSFPVIIAIIRYLQLTLVHRRGGDPTRLLLKDPFLFVLVGIWLGMFYYLIYS